MVQCGNEHRGNRLTIKTIQPKQILLTGKDRTAAGTQLVALLARQRYQHIVSRLLRAARHANVLELGKICIPTLIMSPPWFMHLIVSFLPSFSL